MAHSSHVLVIALTFALPSILSFISPSTIHAADCTNTSDTTCNVPGWRLQEVSGGTIPPASGPDPMMGMETATGFHTSQAYLDMANNRLLDANLKMVRTGMDDIGGGSSGASFNWAARDNAVDTLRAKGIEMHAVVSFYMHVDHGGSMTEWQNNWRYFIQNVFSRYKGKISYYIIDNETDLSNNAVSAADAVAFTKTAYEVSRQIAPDGSIKIESPPPSKVGPYLQQLLDLGITRYADVVGFHVYGGDIRDSMMPNAWNYMRSANAAHGYPMRPMAASETGLCSTWAKDFGPADAHDWRARWVAEARTAFKRVGIDNAILWVFNDGGMDGSCYTWVNNSTFTPIEPEYGEIKNTFALLTPLSAGINGGFEQASDKMHGWQVHTDIDSNRTVFYDRVTFVTNDATSAHGGSGYLKELSGGANQVRRVVDGLTPGRSYTLAAWVSVEGGTGYLKALGYNRLDGGEEKSAQSGTTGWKQLSVSFTPSNPFVVISLENNGGTASWDDVSLQ